VVPPGSSRMAGMVERGNDAKPRALQAFIKKTFRLEIGTDMIPSYKSYLLKQAGGQSAVPVG
jgi:hypothetical protein